jgi:polynucleotide 5'-kinase involved in rRNA processing
MFQMGTAATQRRISAAIEREPDSDDESSIVKVPPTMAVYGAPGSGKSTLALGLCMRSSFRFYFLLC